MKTRCSTYSAKFVKEKFKLIFCNTFSRILYAEYKLIAFSPNKHIYSSSGGIFNRVINKIQHHLANTLTIYYCMRHLANRVMEFQLQMFIDCIWEQVSNQFFCNL